VCDLDLTFPRDSPRQHQHNQTIRDLLVPTPPLPLPLLPFPLSFHTPCNQPRVELAWRMDEENDELMRD
jgi:hypothetical protein